MAGYQTTDFDCADDTLRGTWGGSDDDAQLNVIPFAMGLAGAIVLVYLSARFAAWIEANWWPT